MFFEIITILPHIWHQPCQSHYILSMSSLMDKEYDNLGNIHNMESLEEYYTYHPFCLVVNFCEVLKQGSIGSKGFLLVKYLKI